MTIGAREGERLRGLDDITDGLNPSTTGVNRTLSSLSEARASNFSTSGWSLHAHMHLGFSSKSRAPIVGCCEPKWLRRHCHRRRRSQDTAASGYGGSCARKFRRRAR